MLITKIKGFVLLTTGTIFIIGMLLLITGINNNYARFQECTALNAKILNGTTPLAIWQCDWGWGFKPSQTPIYIDGFGIGGSFIAMILIITGLMEIREKEKLKPPIEPVST